VYFKHQQAALIGMNGNQCVGSAGTVP